MSMTTRFVVRGPKEAAARLHDLFGLLLRRRPSEAEDADAWSRELPRWLVDAFAPEQSPAEKAEWLKRWRAAPPQERGRLERERGWELLQWLHWFSGENDAWRLERAVRAPDGDELFVEVSHPDEPFPVQALEWVVSVAGAEVSAVERIS